jgi:RNA polymerase sigma factor (sigma-70 family)
MTDDSRLSRIVTLWSVVRQAHDGPLDAVQAAQRELLHRYGGAVRRYLLASLRNEDAADEVFQEFALRFVRGDFHRAAPDQGRFRSFLKTVVYRLVVDHQRRQGREARQQELPAEGPECRTIIRLPRMGSSQSWRDELLSRSWNALEEISERENKQYYDVLRLRAEYPDLRSTELAQRLSWKVNKSISAANVRVLLHRARQRFAELLLDEISHSVHTTDIEHIEQELIELNLYGYCREVIRERAERRGGV